MDINVVENIKKQINQKLTGELNSLNLDMCTLLNDNFFSKTYDSPFPGI